MVRSIYQDRAGNKLYITGRKIYAKNRSGRLVNRRGVMTMLRKANKAGSLRFTGGKIRKVY